MSEEAAISRRGFLTGILRPRDAALAATGGLVWSQAIDDARSSELCCRPPGALDDADFLAACVKCGQCVEACPYDTLKLATTSDPVPVGTPWFEPRQTPCYMCDEAPCARVCPSGALKQDVAIKEARMGLAVLVDRENCLALLGLRCEACYRACPLMDEALTLEYQPMERTGKHAFFKPVINSNVCTGCGKCEHVCIAEKTVIKVLPREVAKGRLGDHYQMGWDEDPVISEDFIAPTAPPEIPDWDNNMGDVLDDMDDLSGIVDP